MAGDKTEKATSRKREDERKKGNVFQSNDAVIAFGLIILLVSLKILGPYIFRFFQFIMAKYLGEYATASSFSISNINSFTFEIIAYLAVLVLPLLLISVLASYLISGAQTKFIFKAETIKFKLSKLNPIKGLKKMVSMRGLVDLLKSVLKLAAIGYMMYSSIFTVLSSIPKLLEMDAASGLVFVASNTYDIILKICILILIIAVMDYIYQWWEYERNMRMSKQEIKDEYKLSEGDPKVKNAIRSRQQSMSLSRMMQQLPEADVVITNPTHFAVALQYDTQKHKAPMVIAKGQDLTALRIKEKAKELNIEITENPPLARALYKAAEIGKEIPQEFYQTVAEVLAYVYKLRTKK